MAGYDEYVFNELVRASSLLAGEFDHKYQMRVLVEQALDITHSDLACFYAYGDKSNTRENLKLVYQRGSCRVPSVIAETSEVVEFLEDCKEALILSDRGRPFFQEAFLNPKMNSAIVLPLITPKAKIGLLFLNNRDPNFYNRRRYNFLDSFTKMAAGMLHNAELFSELKHQLRYVEAMERYQENIFSSMTDLLITTDEKGNIHYFNSAANRRLGLDRKHMGKNIHEVFKGSISKKILGTVDKAKGDGKERLGIQGIYKNDREDIDFSLNISPLLTRRGKNEGLTLVFSDQTRERELQEQMDVVVEERRAVKDMFARYLSDDIVKTLVEQPDLVRLGGDKKTATIFFADIRGYTTFSEAHLPEYIIEVLNEYFSKAVEVIIKYRGYIDKFIGDCIMAAWGVPIYSEYEDAVSAVSCAVELQELVKSNNRSFFTGKASHLKVGIGMNTGSLVAGNLGSRRRMDYSVIGDTVNVAARLEGIAEANDILITQSTRELIGDHFKLKALKPVALKGKEKPVPVYKVIKQVS
ncbi:MAG: adenylate/guanylate cyclase domain-containing protein [Spirochaetota bacterium]